MCKVVKTYIEDDKTYRFDREQLDIMITKKRSALTTSEKKVTKTFVMRELSEVTFVSFEAVKNWVYGNNGPSDLEQVKKIADYFGIDYHELLKQEENKMKKDDNIVFDNTSDAQNIQTRMCVREVYVSLYDAVEKIWDYYHSEDTNIIMQFSEEELEKSNITTYERAEEACGKVIDLLNRYLLDIPYSFREKVVRWYWQNVETTLMNITCRFCDPMNEDDPEEIKEKAESAEHLKQQEYKYKEGFYTRELRNLFSEYILP